MSTYKYQAEKFSAARRCLMLPHVQGEAESIADCFRECAQAFDKFDASSLDDDARKWVGELKELMSPKGITEESADEGRFLAKARTFDVDKKSEVSETVSELAHWFSSHSR